MILPESLVLTAFEKVTLPNELTDKKIRTLVKSETQLAVRRLDTFTLISLLAVNRLFSQLNSKADESTTLGNNVDKVPKKLSLYSAAEYLSVDLFQSVLFNMHNNESIRPFDFIATVGNAANFYISKEFNITGPNLFIGASENPFIKSCGLAEIDFLEGFSEQAIIVVWHLAAEQRYCYAFSVEPSNRGKLNTPAKQARDLSIDALIKQGEDIPLPTYIHNLF